MIASAWRRLAGPAALLACAGGAAAATSPGYPASGRTEDVLAWTAASTSIPRSSILITTPGLVVALVRTERRPGGAVEAAVREEVVEPRLAMQMGARSLASEVEFDCAGHRRRFLGDVAYSEPDLGGVPRTIDEPPGWAPIQQGTITAQVEAAVCAPRRTAVPSPAGPRVAVRVGTFAREANARAAASALKGALPDGGQNEVVIVRPISQAGQRYYVVEAEGFAGRAEALAFCRSASVRLPGCVVVPGERKPIPASSKQF